MNKISLFTAAFVFATALTLSCFDSDEDDGIPNNIAGGGASSSSEEASSSSTGAIYGESVDYGGEIYQTVVIGTQTWFSRNLNYDTEGSRCDRDDPANCDIYGRLYDWETAMAICPSGWHLPSKDEWMELIRFVEDDVGDEHDAYNPYYSNAAGMYLTVHEYVGFSDKYGFSATLLGGHFIEGRFGSGLAIWWSASEENDNNADCWAMPVKAVMSFEGGCDKSNFLVSVRCLKD